MVGLARQLRPRAGRGRRPAALRLTPTWSNFAFFLSLSLGALFFVPIQYVTKASWSVVMRRLAEVMAAVLPLLARAGHPGDPARAGKIYGWADARATSPADLLGAQGGLT